MKGYWTQPSLSRDFALLAAAIIFLLFLISTWVTYTSYSNYSERIENDLQKESSRIEYSLESEMESANYMLTSLGRQIILNEDRTLVSLAQMLKAFDSKEYIYSIFTWIDTNQNIIVSSNSGILDRPINVSDRDYVLHAAAEPWKMQIGKPIEGRITGRWVIPVAMGLTDYTGKFIGTIMISLDISTVTERLKHLIRRDGIRFAIASNNLLPLTHSEEEKDFIKIFPIARLKDMDASNASGVVRDGSPLLGAGSYFYYRALPNYPYIILLGYDAHYNDQTVRSMLFSRLLQLLVIAGFFVLFLWIMRARMIHPVQEMTKAASDVSLGKPYKFQPQQGPEEIHALSMQLSRISDYITENKRIEDELRNKVFMLKKAKERSDAAMRSKSEFLAYACQEIRTVLNHIIGFAQTMRDQLHGPIENRKYRQYAADIYSISNTLLGYTQDLLTFSKTETGYITLMEKPVEVPEVVNKTLRFMADKMHSERRNIKVKLQEPSPRLVVDEFRLQQMLTNLLLYIFYYAPAEQTLMLESRIINEGKDKQLFALWITTSDQLFSVNDVLGWLEHTLNESASELVAPERSIDDIPREQADLSLEIVRSLVSAHQGYLAVERTEAATTLAIYFPASRIHTSDSTKL